MGNYNFDKVEKFVPDTAEKRRVTRVLNKGVHQVTWRSLAGKKTMNVTLDDTHIPGDQLLGEGAVTQQTQKGAEVVRAYSTDRKGWRSFNVNDVIELKKING